MTTDMATFFGTGIAATTGTQGQTSIVQHAPMGEPSDTLHNVYRATVSVPQNTYTNALSLTASGYLSCFYIKNDCGNTISDLAGSIDIDGTTVMDINFNGVSNNYGGIVWPPYIFETGTTDRFLPMGGFPLRFKTSLVLKIRSDRSGTNTCRAYYAYILD
tara:strand:- start:632 stop:1111 length:480 start_codon:yes stop_codon:yes gene_type:complete